nr:hypothetical protein CFP56_49287 [Quercus suber]
MGLRKEISVRRKEIFVGLWVWWVLIDESVGMVSLDALPWHSLTKGVADCVCLSLIPTSEGSWVTAVRALRWIDKRIKGDMYCKFGNGDVDYGIGNGDIEWQLLM